MCGLVYYNAGKSKLLKKQTANLVIRDIKPRGPDSQRVFVNHDTGDHFFHTRLAICDLSKNGDQPMVSQDGKYTLIFNGEIYNHLEIRRRKFNSDFKWRGTCDAETLVELFSKYGFIKTLNLLDGCFSIVVHDNISNKTCFARDYFGEKPLYYHVSKGTKVASSRLKTFQILNIAENIDPGSIYEFMEFGYISAPNTIYQNVKKLQAGEYIIISQSNYNKSERGFINNFEFDNRVKKQFTARYFSNNLLHKLKKQIKSRLLGDTSIGLFLSSGVDSNIIGGLCRNLGYRLKKSYTFKFNDLTYDESRYVTQSYVSDFNDAKKIVSSDSLYLDALANISEIYSEPFADSSLLPTIILSKAASKDVKVVLGGDGGDEMFWGYKRYTGALWWDIFNKLRISFLVRPICQTLIAILNMQTFRSVLKERMHINLLKLFRLLSSKTALDAYIRVTRGSSPATGDYLKLVCIRNSRQLPKSLAKSPATTIFRYLDLKYYLPDMVLNKSDGASMHYGVELRAPLLSKYLFEELKQYPLATFLNFKKLKIPLVYMLKQLNLLGVTGTKRGFTPPLPEILRTTYQNEILRFCDEKFLHHQNVFQVKETLNTINDFLLHKNNYSEFTWRFLILQLWLERSYIAVID